METQPTLPTMEPKKTYGLQVVVGAAVVAAAVVGALAHATIREKDEILRRSKAQIAGHEAQIEKLENRLGYWNRASESRPGGKELAEVLVRHFPAHADDPLLGPFGAYSVSTRVENPSRQLLLFAWGDGAAKDLGFFVWAADGQDGWEIPDTFTVVTGDANHQRFTNVRWLNKDTIAYNLDVDGVVTRKTLVLPADAETKEWPEAEENAEAASDKK